jgi:CubicO group peptidase (beta-lactamase class C family)
MEEWVAAGREHGMQLAVYHRGQLIVDAWAGVADVRTGRRVEAETLFPVFSVTKGVTTAVVHQLAQRGVLSYDLPIAEVWPEFAAHGKGAITIRHALMHQAGLPYLPPGMTYAQMLDWKTACDALAACRPKTPPGTHFVYHAKTFGWMLGEVVHRLDGRSFPTIVCEDITRPLGITTLHVGGVNQDPDQVAFLVEEALGVLPPLDPGIIMEMEAAQIPMAHQMNQPAMWAACLPSSNGLMNARAIARFYASLLPGGVDGFEGLSPERVSLATQWETFRDPEGADVVRGLGFQAMDFSLEGSGKARGFGHGGFGGSMGFACPELHLAVGYAHNLLGSGHWESLLNGAMKNVLL